MQHKFTHEKSNKARHAATFFSLVFNDKWTNMVINSMAHGGKGFNELLKHFYISPSNLSAVLKKLEKYGLIRREINQTIPITTTYYLTECAIDYLETIEAAQANFIMKWFDEKEYMEDRYYETLFKKNSSIYNDVKDL